MPDVAKLKKKAAEFELKKQFDKALAVYVEILDGYGASDEEVDVSLFNRVGDLYLKQGSVSDAVDYYEQAVDRYADGGFHNNAIALCNKILRSSPGRATVYYKLGKISAQKGFKGDAKKNFLEYADRMQTAGKIDEAFRALKEFADLCPDQDDIRLMLADQLSRKGRGEEAIEQLQVLYERYSHEGRHAEARATVDRMKAIDPTAEPRELGDAPSQAGSGLVFLDLDDAPAPKRPSIPSQMMAGLDIIDTGVPDVPAPPAAQSESIIDKAPDLDLGSTQPSGSLLDGLESTSFTPAGASPPVDGLLDLEPTSFGDIVDDTPAPPTPTPSAPLPPPAAAAPFDDLLDFDIPSSPTPAPTPASSDMSELELFIPDTMEPEPVPELETIDFGTVELDEPAPPPRMPRPSLLGLPMLIDEEGEEPAPEDDDATIGGDLQLIMPEGTPVRGSVSVPTPSEPAPRRSTVMAEATVDLLSAQSSADPDDNALRRRLAEAMLESGDRDGGLRELETAMVGFEKNDDLASAAMIADEIVLLNPSSVRHHQKRVEFAFRTNERGRLIEAYLQLADALFRAGQADKSRSIYQRVLDLAPDDIRAQSALESFPAAEPEPAPPPPPKARQSTTARRVSIPVAPPSRVPDDEFINLGDWLRDDDVPKDTRMVVDEKEPTGDEAADFQDMLRAFKQGISENVEEEDHQSHYDLGVAYKEMGLLDEAISEFQKALRAPVNRVPTYEALGQCFIEKEQYPMAATILGRALNEPDMSEDSLIGVLYLLGRCAEERGQRETAAGFYQRVFLVDIQFRDVGERLASVEGAAS
jgi:tetratricopeptide (TPR) repeat protein